MAKTLILDYSTESPGLSDSTLWVMAAACGIAAANIYYNQPLLGQFAKTFDASETQAGMVATAAQVGYGIGIFFFCPLGDLIERRLLVLVLMATCCVCLIGAAVAPSLWILIGCQLLIGITAMSAQVLIPLAVDLTPPHKRGHTVGILMAGLLIGILLARTVAGFVGQSFGWSSVFWMAAGLTVIMGLILQAFLPHRAPTLQTSYTRLMHSMIDLLKTQPRLWISSTVSGLSFAGFMAFWTTLVFLMKSHFNQGPRETGMFGFVGVAGALAAPIAGKLSDRFGPAFTITASLLASIAAFIMMNVWVTIPVLILGVLLMDMGVQSIQVAEQSTVMALVPESRSRVNTLYMVGRFMGGAMGSAIGAAAWTHFRWTGVCAACVGLMVAAMGVHVAGVRRRSNSNDEIQCHDD